MAAAFPEAEGTGWIFSLRKLEASFKWEFRCLYLAPIGGVFWFIAPEVALVISGIVAVLFLVLDTVVSIMLTAIFLRSVQNGLPSFFLRLHEPPLMH